MVLAGVTGRGVLNTVSTVLEQIWVPCTWEHRGIGQFVCTGRTYLLCPCERRFGQDVCRRTVSRFARVFVAWREWRL